jgi:uncharacterized circularly permuted ATP-grasp superfamily protein
MEAATPRTLATGLFTGYDTGSFYDEMFSSPAEPRSPYAKVFQRLATMPPEQFEERRKLADLSFLIQGSRSPCTATAEEPSVFFHLT